MPFMRMKTMDTTMGKFGLTIAAHHCKPTPAWFRDIADHVTSESATAVDRRYKVMTAYCMSTGDGMLNGMEMLFGVN